MQLPAPGIIVGFVTITIAATTLGFRIGKNGSKAHGKLYEKINGKVDTEECHRAQDGIKEHMDTRFDDVIRLIEKNGK